MESMTKQTLQPGQIVTVDNAGGRPRYWCGTVISGPSERGFYVIDQYAIPRRCKGGKHLVHETIIIT